MSGRLAGGALAALQLLLPGASAAPAPHQLAARPPARLVSPAFFATLPGCPPPLTAITCPQMEMQLQELVAELSARLPEAALAELDDLAAAAEEVEERLALLKVGGARVGCTGGSWLAAWTAGCLAGGHVRMCSVQQPARVPGCQPRAGGRPRLQRSC